jgi:polyisoprenoid-binding protein YceI
VRTKLLLLIALTFVLAACGSQSTPTTDPPTAAPTKPPTVEPTETSLPTTPAEPTVSSQEEPTPTEVASEPVVSLFKIVPGESQLQYEVGEVFLNQDSRFNVAVGVTRQISGEISGDRDNPQTVTFSTFKADISQFTSDSNRRDNAIRNRFLESTRFPEVTFNVTEVEGIPDTYQDGQEVALQISGELTVREVTQPVTFDAVVKLEGDTLSGVATTTILMSDFGFGPISIAGILNTEDEVKVTLTFVARP